MQELTAAIRNAAPDFNIIFSIIRAAESGIVNQGTGKITKLYGYGN